MNTPNPQPVLTVGLPIINMQNIAWLAMESLCRQEFSQPWELIIVCEKQMGPTPKFFEQYYGYLKAANCVRIELIQPDLRMHLNIKWRTIALASSPSSTMLVLQAGDCYSHPQRLAQHYAYHHADWHNTLSGYFYNISSKKTALFSTSTAQATTGLDMAMSLKWARKLNKIDGRSAGVDQYLYAHCQRCKGKPLRVKNFALRPGGLDTHGHNVISKQRGGMIDNLTHHFTSHAHNLETLVPTDVLARLKKMA